MSRNKVVISIVSGLDENQAAKLSSSIAKSKMRIAPGARGTSAITDRENVKKILSSGTKQISEGGKDDED